MNLTLIGMPGSGKSTVGVLLAKALGFGFIDTDLILQQREDALLQDILDQRGVEAFLDAEAAAICSLICDRCVIAPGGSAVCRPDAMAHLKRLGDVLYLNLSCAELEKRMDNFATRGIAMAPGETLQDVYDRRAPLYRRYADYAVAPGSGRPEDTANAARRAFLSRRAAFGVL